MCIEHKFITLSFLCDCLFCTFQVKHLYIKISILINKFYRSFKENIKATGIQAQFKC